MGRPAPRLCEDQSPSKDHHTERSIQAMLSHWCPLEVCNLLLTKPNLVVSALTQPSMLIHGKGTAGDSLRFNS